jgi:glycosyltransferase involved in cell wall biosynthesis
VRVTHFRITGDGKPLDLRRRVQAAVLRRWVDKYSTDILAVSRGTMAAAWHPDWQSDPRCRVVYNGIDLKPFAAPRDREGVCRELGVPADATLYMHVGRIDEQKNHLRLAGIFAEVVRRDPAGWLVLVGRGGNELERRLRSQLAAVGVAQRVVFAGLRSDVPRLLKAADLMVFPSLFEGLPGAVLEACAAGTPVLASDIEVHRETAGHLRSVVTLPLESPDGVWAGAAARLAAEARRDPELRTRAAQAFAASPFSIDECVRANVAVWEGSRETAQGPAPVRGRRVPA